MPFRRKVALCWMPLMVIAVDFAWLRVPGSDSRTVNDLETYLDGANLSDADLREGNLSGTNLRGADLTGAQLPGAKLVKANPTNANLIRADLSFANLTGANLSRADLLGADLSRKTDLSDAQNLTPAQLDAACGQPPKNL